MDVIPNIIASGLYCTVPLHTGHCESGSMLHMSIADPDIGQLRLIDTNDPPKLTAQKTGGIQQSG
jgi:hypothetical protein